MAQGQSFKQQSADRRSPPNPQGGLGNRKKKGLRIFALKFFLSYRPAPQGRRRHTQAKRSVFSSLKQAFMRSFLSANSRLFIDNLGWVFSENAVSQCLQGLQRFFDEKMFNDTTAVVQ